MELKEYRDWINKSLVTKSNIKHQLNEEKRFLSKSHIDYENATEALNVIQSISENIQNTAHKQIVTIVQRCLSTVFTDPDKFDIKFQRKRNNTEAKLVFERNKELVSPLDGSGGGQIDVAAFALRLASIVLQKPSRRRVLILDEPFKNVHGKENRERLVDLIESLCEDFQLQIIMVTGMEWLRVGEVVDISLL